MRLTILPILFLLACNSEPEKKINPEGPLADPTVRKLSFDVKEDGTAQTFAGLPSCDKNCKLWRVESPEETLFFCFEKGQDWLQLSSYVGPDETMYCDLQ